MSLLRQQKFHLPRGKFHQAYARFHCKATSVALPYEKMKCAPHLKWLQIFAIMKCFCYIKTWNETNPLYAHRHFTLDLSSISRPLRSFHKFAQADLFHCKATSVALLISPFNRTVVTIPITIPSLRLTFRLTVYRQAFAIIECIRAYACNAAWYRYTC